jgi:plastocyanin
MRRVADQVKQEDLKTPTRRSLHNVDIKGGDVEIGPFTTTGVFHIYCTLHTGMNLTIVVQ